MKRLLVMMLLLYPMSAAAETYQWTDEQGTVNFAEDLGKVPKKFRKKAKRLGAEESGVPQVTETTEQVQGKSKSVEDQKGKLYGGKNESAWRRDFVIANLDLQQSEAELADLRRRLVDTSKMSRSEYLNIQASIKHSESRLEQRKKRLDLLTESADRLGVPMEWRQELRQ
jgi:hypothetical protein